MPPAGSIILGVVAMVAPWVVLTIATSRHDKDLDETNRSFTCWPYFLVWLVVFGGYIAVGTSSAIDRFFEDFAIFYWLTGIANIIFGLILILADPDEGPGPVSADFRHDGHW